MKEKLTFLQATGDFPFQFYIEKAIPVISDDGILIVEGVASTVNIDHDNERMASGALSSMAQQINTTGVPLRIEHDKNDRAIVGDVYKAWVDERDQLWIRAAINPNHPAGPMLHESLRQGAKFGLSVGGRVKNAIKELSEATGKMVKTFYDVSLDEVSVTKRPANYDAWLFAKSYKEKDQDVSPFYKSPLFKEFLSLNPQLDYAYQFAKSIPDKAWIKIENNNLIIDKNMNDKEENKDKAEDTEEEKKDKSEETEEEKEKSFVSKAEFSKFSLDVTKGIASITKFLKEMTTNAKDTVNPDKDKDETIGDTEKSEEGSEDKDKSEDDAMDQTNPNKPKEENIGETSKKRKGMKKTEEDEKEKDKSEEDEKEKSEEDGNGDTEKAEEDEEEKDKAEESDEEKDKAEKDPETLDEAVKSIENMTKRLFGQKTTKSSIQKSQKTLTQIDVFAAAISKAVMGMEERFEKSGTTVPGLARMISDMIQNDPEIQKSISSMLKEPGFKKSVSMSVPYMVSKDGKRFALSATPVDDEVKKSTKGKTFKEVYKSDYSAFGDETR